MKEVSILTGHVGIFATRLRELMKTCDVTQQDVATAIGTTRQAISQYADGLVQPNIEKLYRMAEYFKVSADYLLGISDITSVDMDDKAIAECLGLSEISITTLKENPNKAGIVNLLLSERADGNNTILSILEQIFAIQNTVIARDEKGYPIVTHQYINTEEDAFMVKMLRLQQRVYKYKDEIDQNMNGGK